MKYTQDIQSKSGKQISVLVFENSLNPTYTIIESHGGYQGNKEKVAQDNKVLVEFCEHNNLNYVSIDLSNNGTQSDEPSNELRYGHRIKDVETVIDFVVSRYQSPIILLGSSLGGCVTLNAATYSPMVKKVILNCAAVKPHECVQATIDKSEFDNWKVKGIANVWGVPMAYDFYEDLVNNNALKVIPRLNIPILWFHGTDDQVVPITQAYEAKQLNPNIKLIEIKDGGHRFGDKMESGSWDKQVQEFVSG